MIKRLFFALECTAPWPHHYPTGRLLEEHQRHLTLAFLGNIEFDKLNNLLENIPVPSFKVGTSAIFDQCLFLPPRHPNVVAWHMDWKNNNHSVLEYQQVLVAWLENHGFSTDEKIRPFLPHVTIARSPFIIHQWKKDFSPLPCFVSNLHLYESLGNLQYKPLWTFMIKNPIEEIEHTADIAFLIRGENINQLWTNAQMALAFRHPEILPFLSTDTQGVSLDQMVMDLNEILAKADSEIGCPFKAVSFHGNIINEPDGTLLWEMIVDV